MTAPAAPFRLHRPSQPHGDMSRSASGPSAPATSMSLAGRISRQGRSQDAGSEHLKVRPADRRDVMSTRTGAATRGHLPRPV